MKGLEGLYIAFRNTKMHKKIIGMCMVIIVTSSIVTGITIYRASAYAIEEKVNNHVKEVLEQSTKFMDEKLKSMLIQIHFLQTTEMFNEVLGEILGDSDKSYAYYFTQFEPLLTQIRSRDDYMHSLQIVTPKGSFTDFLNQYENEDLMLKDFNLALAYKNSYVHRRLVHWGNGGDSWKAGTVPIMLKISAKQLLGSNDDDIFMIMNLNKFAFNKYLLNMAEQINGWVFIIDRNNSLVFESHDGIADRFIEPLNEHSIQNNQTVTIQEQGNYLVNTAKFSINNWRMVCVQSEEAILEDLKFIKHFTIFSVLSVILCIFIFAVFMAKSMTRPMKKLQELMERAPREGFNPRFQSDYQDEVGQLGTSFNGMSEKIKALIGELEEDKVRIKNEQLLKRKAELKALQAQINPHFLYNALDSIYWKSILDGNKEVGDMAIALSNLFRTGLNKGQELTTIGKEIEHVKSYLAIQKIIYEDMFDYEVEVTEEELLSHPMLKLVLQPLVENSILHGFRNVETRGHIGIQVYKESSHIHLIVTDDGQGFDTEKVIVNKLENVDLSKDYSGYALGNVFQRLQLQYGEAFRLNVESEQGIGTRIKIRIPLTS